MASSYTLLQLRTRVREMGEYEDPFISDAELTSYLNSGITRWRIRAHQKDPSLFTATDNVSVSAGTEAYSLPTGAQKVQAVAVTVGGRNYLLDQIEWQDRYLEDINAVVTSAKAMRYAIRGNEIYFFKPVAATVRVDYFVNFTNLSADGDTFDRGVDGWDKWVCADALIVCATKAEDDISGWQLLKAQAEQIMDWTVNQNGARPKTITDTVSGQRGRWGRHGWYRY